MMRRVLIVLVVLVAAFGPAEALSSMGHCQTMTAACQTPCASSACVATRVPLLYTPRAIDSAAMRPADRVPETPFGSLDPPPRPLSLPA